MLGFILLFVMSALRMVDSTLTLAQRGIYFLAAGLVMALVCLAVYWPRRKNRRKGKRKPVTHSSLRSEQPMAVQKKSQEVPAPDTQETWKTPPVPVFHRPGTDKGGNDHDQTK